MANRKLRVLALVVILFFTFGVWCTSFLVSNLPTLTSQRSDFECSFGLVSRSLSNNALTSSRTDGFAKGSQFWLTAGFPLRASKEPLFLKQDIDSAPQITSAKKVPIHLINSVLTI